MARRFHMPTQAELSDHVMDYVKKKGLGQARFGAMVLGDPNFLRQMRRGRDMKLSTARKLVEYIEQNP